MCAMLHLCPCSPTALMRASHFVFREIVLATKTAPFAYKLGKPDAVGHRGAPVQLYVLASLTHLAHGHDFETTIQSDTGVSKASLLKFHHEFTKLWGTGNLYRTHVARPGLDDDEELARLAQP